MDATEDQDIVSLFEQRNERALVESEQQYGALCRFVARGITGNDEDAEECTNDAMLAVWNTIPPLKPMSFRSYLLKLVRNAALDRYRAAHTDKRVTAQFANSLDELAEIIPDGSDVATETERREMLDAVTVFLRRLPQKQCALFVQRYWYASDIASLVNTNTAHLYSKKGRT